MGIAVSAVLQPLNKSLSGLSPTQIILLVLALNYILANAPKTLVKISRIGLRRFLFLHLFPYLKLIPSVKQKMDKDYKKVREDFRHSLTKETANEEKFISLPEKGIDEGKLLALMKRWKQEEDHRWKEGKVSGAVYYGNEKLSDFCGEVYKMFALSNPLHPDVFPFTRKMEAEIISMCLRLFNGGEDSCGVMTSGGTESIMLAMKAYRDWARAEKGIVSPEIIIAKTAHAAFHKAGSTFGIDVIEVDVDPKTFRLTVDAVRPYVGRNTIAIVGSSPNFPQGVIDDIPNLSKFAESRGIPFHNDCCLGSFMLPFAEKLGYPISTFDFRNSGITSISMDTHKYGYAPKGSSVVMYSNPKYRQYQYYTSPDWSGGIYATPGFAGSRPGALVAVTWATLLRVGAEGYEATVSAILETAAAIRKGISSIPGLVVLGDSELSVVCIGTTPESGLSAYSVADKMTQMGWNLNSLQNPACFHICCTYLQRDKAPAFLSDLSRAVELAPASDGKGAAAAMYGMAGSLPDSSLVGEAAKIYLDEFYTI